MGQKPQIAVKFCLCVGFCNVVTHVKLRDNRFDHFLCGGVEFQVFPYVHCASVSELLEQPDNATCCPSFCPQLSSIIIFSTNIIFLLECYLVAEKNMFTNNAVTSCILDANK